MWVKNLELEGERARLKTRQQVALPGVKDTIDEVFNVAAVAPEDIGKLTLHLFIFLIDVTH